MQARPHHWYTVLEASSGGEDDDGSGGGGGAVMTATTFRVRRDAASGGAATDACNYIDALAASLYELADSGQVLEAARAAYQAIPVDVWIGDETGDGGKDADLPPVKKRTTALDDGDDDGALDMVVVDLWAPMQLALALRRAEALEQLLCFHEEYATSAMSALAAATELPPPTTTSAAQSNAARRQLHRLRPMDSTTSPSGGDEAGTSNNPDNNMTLAAAASESSLRESGESTPRVVVGRRGIIGDAGATNPTTAAAATVVVTPRRHQQSAAKSGGDVSPVPPSLHLSNMSSPLPVSNMPSGGGGGHADPQLSLSPQRQQRATAAAANGNSAVGGGGTAPLLECQQRRELGHAIVLLGHYEGPQSAAGRRSLSRTASVTTTAATSSASPAAATTGGSGMTAAHIEEITGTPHSHSLSAPMPPPPSADEEAAAARRSNTINEMEQRFLADRGEEFCVANILGALKPVLVRVVQGLKDEERRSNSISRNKNERKKSADSNDDDDGDDDDGGVVMCPIASFALETLRDHCGSFIELLRRPVLAVDAAILYAACDGGKLARLSAVLPVFQGALTPILTGKKFFSLQLPTGNGGGGGGATQSSPFLHSVGATASATCTSRNSSNVPTPRNQSLSRGNTTTTNAAGAPPSSSPYIVHATSPSSSQQQQQQHLDRPPPEPFWLSCPPQDAQRLAFYALWINDCEQNRERPGSARQRRASHLLGEHRMILSSFRRMREGNHVPPACVWSGHMFLISRLLSTDCTVEEFLDLTGDGGYLSALSPASTPGSFVALLAAGAAAAACVAEPTALRQLTKKVESVLHTEPPSRVATALRVFLAAQPDTHAERFEELWLGATAFSGPKKFKTRVEMLFFTGVELTLTAAERVWRAAGLSGGGDAAGGGSLLSQFSDDHDDNNATGVIVSVAALAASPARRAECQQAIQVYISVWRAFLAGARDRGFHRRSLSRSSVGNMSFSAGGGEARLTPRFKPLPDAALAATSGSGNREAHGGSTSTSTSSGSRRSTTAGATMAAAAAAVSPSLQKARRGSSTHSNSNTIAQQHQHQRGLSGGTPSSGRSNNATSSGAGGAAGGGGGGSRSITPMQRGATGGTTSSSSFSAQAAAGLSNSRDVTTTATDTATATATNDVVDEFADTVRKVCRALPGRLQHGKPPLPDMYTAVYPHGHDTELAAAMTMTNASSSGGGGLAGSGSPASYSLPPSLGASTSGCSGGGGGINSSSNNNPNNHTATSGGCATADKPLPVSSLDSEFAHVQQCFADEADAESNEIKLKFYGLYKQATTGDTNTSSLWMMDTVGRAKWDAWNRCKGMSVMDAKRLYVNEYKLMKEMRASQAGSRR